jgi:hypothetical protein
VAEAPAVLSGLVGVHLEGGLAVHRGCDGGLCGGEFALARVKQFREVLAGGLACRQLFGQFVPFGGSLFGCGGSVGGRLAGPLVLFLSPGQQRGDDGADGGQRQSGDVQRDGGVPRGPGPALRIDKREPQRREQADERAHVGDQQCLPGQREANRRPDEEGDDPDCGEDVAELPEHRPGGGAVKQHQT